MASSIAETIRLDFGSQSPAPNVQMVSSGQSLAAMCAAVGAARCRARHYRAANGDGERMSADGHVAAVRHV